MFLGWPNASFIEAEDSITFFTEMLDGTATYHPNHLLFEPLYKVVLDTLGGASAFHVLQSLTALFALFGLAGLYALVAPRNGPVAALFAIWLTATTFTYWHYGKVIDAYVPALACAIWSLALFDRQIAHPSIRTVFMKACALSAAVLIHQMYIVLALLMCLALQRQSHRNAGLFATTGIVLVGGAYLIAFLSLETDHGFLAWSLGRAQAGLWDAPDVGTPLKAVMGLTRVFIHISALFASDTLSALATNAVGTDRLVEEIYLAQTALDTPLGRALPVLAVAYTLALLALCVSGVPHISRDLTAQLLISAAAIYAILVLIWEPSNNEFWLHIIVFLFILLAPALAKSRARRALAFTAIACAAALNFSAGIYPLSDQRNDYWAQLRSGLSAKVPAGGTVVAECPWLCQKYLRLSGRSFYFFDGHGLDLKPDEPLYLTSWALDPPFDLSNDARAAREKNLLQIEARFGPLPKTGDVHWTDPTTMWRWDNGWIRIQD